MHCNFIDIESQNVLEVELTLDQDGNLSQEDPKSQLSQLKSVTIE
jgi:hypothetical protein